MEEKIGQFILFGSGQQSAITAEEGNYDLKHDIYKIKEKHIYLNAVCRSEKAVKYTIRKTKVCHG